MKKVISLSIVLLAIIPSAIAETCKGCAEGLSNDLGKGAVLSLCAIFLIATAVFFIFNNVLRTKRKNPGLTFCFAIIGCVFGLIAAFRIDERFFWTVIFTGIVAGAMAGYFLSVKRKPDGEKAKGDTKPEE